LQIILCTTKDTKKIRGEMPGILTLPVSCFIFVLFVLFVVNAYKKCHIDSGRNPARCLGSAEGAGCAAPDGLSGSGRI
jgi:hypothetical protein